jgi:hypothetical protein
MRSFPLYVIIFIFQVENLILSNFMEQNPSWETISLSISEECSRFLWN